MASLYFPAYGSLYFADAPLAPDSKIPFEQGFCVGPHCSPVFWNRNLGEHLTSYCRGLIDTGFSRLPKEAVNNRKLLPYQGSIQDHIRFLETSRELCFTDFHRRNIYVSPEEPTVITGLIDWQSTSIEPAFIYANETPDFAALPRVPEEDPPENEQNETETSRQKERDLKDASVCYQTYDVVMTALAPKLRPARLLDPTLFRLFHYCHTTWRDSAVAVRQELIELSARWAELGLEGSYHEDFEAVQALKSWLRDKLDTNSDGWIPTDAWDAARVAHRAAYDEWIQTAKEAESRGEDMTVAKADKMWPLDAR
ncbi:hypothetical protein BJX61DRAFT_537863 [Aspergillus egyptiacus]|nr:hypothetical protein BJX61DRAFT_537863 [Aspergillus egyptiacus]